MNAERRIMRAKRARRWRRVVTALAAVVVFWTTYALILPAITMTRACEKQEHTHTDACYRKVSGAGETISHCTAPTDGSIAHQHSAICYDEAGKLWCELPVAEGHAHTDGCFEALTHTHEESCYEMQRGALLCEEEEMDGHAHTDACRDEEGNLICGMEESDGHTHMDGCYEWEEVLVCGMEDGEAVRGGLTCELMETPGHTHTSACFEVIPAQEDNTLHCTENHEHTARCYGTWELVCTLEEHTHADACQAAGDVPADEDAEVPAQDEEAPAETPEGGEQTTEDGENPVEENQPGENAPEYICGLDAHAHTDACMNEAGEVICGKQAHEHTSACVTPSDETPAEETPEEPEEDPAGEEDAESQTYLCGLDAHEHTDMCFDAQGNLVCEKQVHTHTDACLPAPEESAPEAEDGFACGILEHAHAAGCFNEAGETICGQEAHTHTAECVELGALERAAVEKVNEEIAALSSCEALAAEFDALEEAGDEAGLILAMLEARSAWEAAQEDYDALSEAQKLCVEDAEKLLSLQELWQEMMLPELEDEFTRQIERLEALEELTEEDRKTADDLLEALGAAHRAGYLTDEAYLELYARVSALFADEYSQLAEPCEGTNWLLLRDSGWFDEYADAGQGVSLLSGEMMLGATAQTDTAPSNVQIDSTGGSTSDSTDGVYIDKTIKGTELENVFDITLTVETPTKIETMIEEPDMAVVIVMDISKTMNTNFGNSTRYKAAMDAAESFLDKFTANNSLGVSKVGYVAFNTDAHKIFDLQQCTTEAEANALKNTMRQSTGNIMDIYKNDKTEEYKRDRFTNIEAGLKMAQDMLSGVKNQNKYIIFLSDGFPTTYIESGYQGKYTYDKNFYDSVLNRWCLYGTSYSDTAAIKARQCATAIKNSGIQIFSIGVDVGGQSLQEYINQSATSDGFSVVERTDTSYEIGGTSAADFIHWLKYSIGSGEGHYYDSTNVDGLTAAYNDIFEKIKTEIITASQADWVAADPIPSLSSTGIIDFIGLYDKEGVLQGETLEGSSAEGGENTATFEPQTEQDDIINWDLKKSGYQVISGAGDGKIYYRYELSYRVRLENESEDFVENKVYHTNGDAKLSYRVVQTVNGELVISEQKELPFKKPAVHGFLGELSFRKVDSLGRAVAGAEFTLVHSDYCKICRGDETAVTVEKMVAESDKGGMVLFTNIPSGHIYTLAETKVPDGYARTGEQYTVTVAYDKVTVTVTDYAGQNPKDFDGKIVNTTYYALPSTGGAGAGLYTAGGAGLMALAVWLAGKRNIARRARRKNMRKGR